MLHTPLRRTRSLHLRTPLWRTRSLRLRFWYEWDVVRLTLLIFAF